MAIYSQESAERKKKKNKDLRPGKIVTGSMEL